MYDLFYGLLVVNSRVSLIGFWWLQNKVKVTNGKNHVKVFRFTCKKFKESSSNNEGKSIQWRLGFLEDLKWPRIQWKTVFVGAFKSKLFSCIKNFIFIPP